MSLPFTPVLAPMAGYTDLPLRRVCRRYGLHYGTTALIDAGALVHGNPDSEAILHRGEEEEFLQVQLLGSIPSDIRRSVEILRD
ncbi:MAG: tRNA-dihydrouridine synthase, partial [Lentisphaeria bacterium]|nr:tRNA-dihydrouridine synthase [Lentisphaeria bacterium]